MNTEHYRYILEQLNASKGPRIAFSNMFLTLPKLFGWGSVW